MPRRYGRFIRRRYGSAIRRTVRKSRTYSRRRRTFTKAVRRITKRTLWRKTESKYYISALSGNFDWAAGTQALGHIELTPQITQGTTRSTRTGNKIQFAGMYVRLNLTRVLSAVPAGGNYLPSWGDVRIIIWKPKVVDTTITSAEFFINGTNTMSLYDQTFSFINKAYATVIYDKRVSIGYQGYIFGSTGDNVGVVPTTKNIWRTYIKVPYKNIMNFEDDANSLPRNPSNKVYISIVNNDGVTLTRYAYTIVTRAYFKDI